LVGVAGRLDHGEAAMSNIYEMLRCAEREVKMRKRVYPRWTEQGRMSVVEAAHEIHVMEQIAEHLRELVEAEQPRLFKNGSPA
jgi:signal recognition particle subunit SEC65